MPELMDIVEAEDITLTTKQAIEALEANRPQKGYIILNKAIDMAIHAIKSNEVRRRVDEHDERQEELYDEVCDFIKENHIYCATDVYTRRELEIRAVPLAMRLVQIMLED